MAAHGLPVYCGLMSSPNETGTAYSPVMASVLEDPHRAYAELRAQCPVHVGDVDGVELTTIADPDLVRQVLIDWRTWSNGQGPGLGISASTGDMQHDDPPIHSDRRAFARDAFLPRAVAKLEASIRVIAEAQAEKMAQGTTAELYHDFALPLPVTSFCELMGVELDDRGRFLRWADALTNAMAYPETGKEARRDLNAFTKAEVAARRVVADQGGTPPAGLLSHLAVDEWTHGERMDIDEVVNMSNQLLIAGHETTTSLITNLVWRLLEDPQRWDRLVEEPALVEQAVEESLRFDPPVLGLCRTATTDSELGGLRVREDAKVMMLYASANRDEKLFDRADEFVLDRPLVETKQHLSFSWGIHHCLGAHLARLTARIGIEVLLEHFPELRLNGDTERVMSPFLWGRKQLPVRF